MLPCALLTPIVQIMGDVLVAEGQFMLGDVTARLMPVGVICSLACGSLELIDKELLPDSVVSP
jgi:hypothetical protein